MPRDPSLPRPRAQPSARVRNVERSRPDEASPAASTSPHEAVTEEDTYQPLPPDPTRSFELPPIVIPPFPSFGPIQTGRSTTPRIDRQSRTLSVVANSVDGVEASASDEAAILPAPDDQRASRQASNTAEMGSSAPGTTAGAGGAAAPGGVGMDPFSSGLGSFIAQAVIGALANGALQPELAGGNEPDAQGGQGHNGAGAGAGRSSSAARGAAAGAAAASRGSTGSFSLMIHPDGTVRQVDTVAPPPPNFFAAAPSSAPRPMHTGVPPGSFSFGSAARQPTPSNENTSTSNAGAGNSASNATFMEMMEMNLAASAAITIPLNPNPSRSVNTQPIFIPLPDGGSEIDPTGPQTFNFGPMRRLSAPPSPAPAAPDTADDSGTAASGNPSAPFSFFDTNVRARPASGFPFTFGSNVTTVAVPGERTGSGPDRTRNIPGAFPFAPDRPRDVPAASTSGQTPASNDNGPPPAGPTDPARQVLNFQLPPPAPGFVPVIRWLGDTSVGGPATAANAPPDTGNGTGDNNPFQDGDPDIFGSGNFGGVRRETNRLGLDADGAQQPTFAILIGRPPSEPTDDPRRAQDLIKGLRTLTVRLARRLERVSRKERSIDEGSDEGWKCSICFDGWEGAEDVPNGDQSGGADAGSSPTSRQGGAEGGAALDLDARTDIKALPCNHFFHRGCLEPWFSTKHTCPSCRFDVSPYALSLRQPSRIARPRTVQAETTAPGLAPGTPGGSRQPFSAPPGVVLAPRPRRPQGSHPANPPTRAEAAATMNAAASRHPLAAAIGAVSSTIGSVVAHAGRAVSAVLAPGPSRPSPAELRAQRRQQIMDSMPEGVEERRRFLDWLERHRLDYQVTDEELENARESLDQSDRLQEREDRIQRQGLVHQRELEGDDPAGEDWRLDDDRPPSSLRSDSRLAGLADVRSEAATPSVDDLGGDSAQPSRPSSTSGFPPEYQMYLDGGVPIDTAQTEGTGEGATRGRPVFSASPLPMDTARLPGSDAGNLTSAGRTPTQQILDAAARDGIGQRPVPQRHLHIHGRPQPPAGTEDDVGVAPLSQTQQPGYPGVNTSAASAPIAPTISVSSPEGSPGSLTQSPDAAGFVPSGTRPSGAFQLTFGPRPPSTHTANGSGFMPSAAAGSSAPAPTFSLFGPAPVSSTGTGTSLFGPPSAQAAHIPYDDGLFGRGRAAPVPSTGQSVFGVAPSAGQFGTNGPSSTGLFGRATSTQPTSATGLFGTRPAGPVSGSAGNGLFGQPPTGQGGSSFFGASPTNGQAGSSLFGASSTTGQAGSSLFGASATSGQGGGFGALATRGQGGSSLFGASSTSGQGGTSSTSLFSFGNTPRPAAQTGQGNGHFGPRPADSTRTMTGHSLFGDRSVTSATSTTSSLFGSGATASTGADMATGSAASAAFQPSHATNMFPRPAAATSAAEPSLVPGTRYPPVTPQPAASPAGSNAGQGANTATWDSAATPFSPPLAPRDEFSHLPPAFAAELRRMAARDAGSLHPTTAGGASFGGFAVRDRQPDFTTLPAPSTTTASADASRTTGSLFSANPPIAARTRPTVSGGFAFASTPALSGSNLFGPAPASGTGASNGALAFGSVPTGPPVPPATSNPARPIFTFGAAAPVPPASSFAFGNPPLDPLASVSTPPRSPGSAFNFGPFNGGATAARPTTQPSLFGPAPSASGQRSSFFGGSAASFDAPRPAPVSFNFGSGASAARPTTQTSLSGSAASAGGQAAGTSLFGNPAASSGPSRPAPGAFTFSSGASASRPATSLFGNAPSAPQLTIFGIPINAFRAHEQASLPFPFDAPRPEVFAAFPTRRFGAVGSGESAPSAPRPSTVAESSAAAHPTNAANGPPGAGQGTGARITSIFVDFGTGGPPAGFGGFGQGRPTADRPRRAPTIPLRTWLEKREQEFGWRCSKETCEVFPADDDSLDYKDIDRQIRDKGEAGIDLDLVPLFAAQAPVKEDEEGVGKGKGKAKDEGQRKDEKRKRLRGNDGARVASGSGGLGGSEAGPSSSVAEAPPSPARAANTVMHRHEVTGEKLACGHRFHPICILHHLEEIGADGLPQDVDEEAQRTEVVCPRCEAVGWVDKVHFEGEGSVDEFFPAVCGHEGHENCWHD